MVYLVWPLFLCEVTTQATAIYYNLENYPLFDSEFQVQLDYVVQVSNAWNCDVTSYCTGN